MKLLKLLRLILAAMMIGFSVILPGSHKDGPQKHRTEQRDKLDDDPED